VYMDDMITKYKEKEDHIQALRKRFKRLWKYRLKLNPTKCTLKVKFGKLLEFMVSNKGTKIDPNKVMVIQQMLTPKTGREV